MKNARNRGFKHCGNIEQSSVLACGFREVTDAIVVRIVNGRRVTVYRSGLVVLLGLITCLETGLGQVAKLYRGRAEVRLTRAFGSGRARQGSRGRQSRESGLEVTVREQQGWRVKHENGEGEMEMCDICMQQTFLTTLSHACVCTRMNMCGCAQTKCVCDSRVCAHHPSRTR